MKRPKELSAWDFADTVKVRDGYDIADVPDLTRDNFNYLLEHYNNLVEVVNRLADTPIVKVNFEEE